VRLDHPEPADRPGQPTADRPFIPNGSPRLPSDHPPPDIPDIPKTADYRAAVDAAYREYAIDQGCTRVREIEEHVVTPAMRRIEAEDPNRHLVGLDHRLKGEARLTEKVRNWMDAEPTLTAEKAFSLLKDSIRYTFAYREDRYADGVEADCGRLEAEGFELVERRNSWSNDQYKGINSRWRVPESGQVFEVQFHTEASFEAKQETHWAYEKLRSSSTTEAEQDELVEYQRRVTGRVEVPPGAPGIPGYP
jgi:hypothetical protein